MNFKPGDKVVCVDDSTCTIITGHPLSGKPFPLKKGGVYCVNSVIPKLAPGDNGGGLTIVGYDLGWCAQYAAPFSFIASRFRLVSEVKLIMEAVRHNHIGKEVPAPIERDILNPIYP